MPTTAEKLREMRKTVHGNFDKILRKYYDEVNAQKRGEPLPHVFKMEDSDSPIKRPTRASQADNVKADKDRT